LNVIVKHRYLLLGLIAAIASNAANAAGIGTVLDRALRQQSIPGVSAAIVRDGRFVYSGGRGVADLGTGRAMDDTTVMYIGSLSKILTAVLALHEVERGRLAMTDTLERAPTITVLDLLVHRSGLPREGGFGYWFSGEFPDVAALAAYVNRAGLDFAPGSRTGYSNVGYAALGQFIAERAGQDFETLLRDRVLMPLGMTDSGARGPAPGLAQAYTPPGRLLPDAKRPFAGVSEAIDGRHVRVYHDAAAMSPAFGAYSTARDMGRLLRFLLGDCGNDDCGDDVLSEAMRARMFEPVASSRGLGLRLESIDGRRVARHGGWFAAYRSHLLLDRARGIGIVVLANSDSASPGDIVDALYRAVAQAALPDGDPSSQGAGRPTGLR